MQQNLKNTPELRKVSLEDVVALAIYEKNRSAVRVLYERYKDLLVSRLRSLVNNGEAAEDLAHDTFARVWELIQLGQVSQETINRFEPWLYRIATNRAIDDLRRAKKLQFVSYSDNEPDENNGRSFYTRLSATGHEERVCDRLLLEQAVAAMSPKYRVCYLLRHQWDYKYAEIAEILGISEKAVGQNITRGYRQLHMIYTSMLSGNDMTKGGRKRYGKINLRSFRGMD